MRIGIPSLDRFDRGDVIDRDLLPENLGSLGIDLSNIPMINPVTPPPLPSLPLVDKYKKLPLGSTGYVEPNVATEESQLSLTPGPGLLPYQPFGKDGPILYGTQEQIDAAKAKAAARSAITDEDGKVLPGMTVEPEKVAEAVAKALGAVSGEASGLGPFGTSGIAMMEDEPITMASDSTSPMSPMVEPEVTPMDSDIDRMIEKAIASATASGEDMPVQAADDPILTIDPVQAAVDAAVGNGQPTTDDTILDKDAMEDKVYLSYSGSDEGGNYIVANGKKTYIPDSSLTDDTISDPDDMVVGGALVTQYYNPATGETFTQYNTAQPVPEGFIPGSPPETPAQPDFMTQLNELIASMQAEQTTAAEQAAAAEAERQKQAAEMTQNYMVGQPAVGYNPYESGQYQNNPYGAAGVPAMGGITTIPVPAAYNPNPYPIGGTT